MKGAKVKEEKRGCPECGGKLVPEEDRLVCSICGHPVFSKALRHKYLERNKNAIMKDLNILPRETVLKKWGIPASTLSQCLRRWKCKPAPKNFHPPRARLRLPITPGGNGRLPAFPEFSNEWTPEVQLAWIECYAELRKEVK
jgi:ribosomal protein S27AE